MVNWREIQITVPMSLNNIYVNMKSGRRKSPEYNSWLRLTQWEIKSHKVEKVNGPYQLEIEVGRSTTRADIDNLIKPISDALVKESITDDDAKMMRCAAKFTDRKNVLIRVAEYEE